MKSAPATQPATTTSAAVQVAGLMLTLMAPATRYIWRCPSKVPFSRRDQPPGRLYGSPSGESREESAIRPDFGQFRAQERLPQIGRQRGTPEAATRFRPSWKGVIWVGGSPPCSGVEGPSLPKD